jgi:threonine/homoserine/homoserine lactone efflux protein
MKESLIEGISIGLVLSTLVGPVFFALIRNSIENGFRYAAILASGILVSDSLYVLVTYFGISFLSNTTYFELVLGTAGGLILTGFGIRSLLKKTVPTGEIQRLPFSQLKKRNAFAIGFGINGINPFVLLFWISIASLVSLKEQWTGGQVRVYYAGILTTVFVIDLLKAYVAKQLSQFVTPRLMAWLNRLAGGVMIYFGVRMLWTTYFV